MANIREISGRMKSIRDTMKITNAMYMISSTKMRKAKKNQEGNVPYFEQLQKMFDRIIAGCPELDNTYLDERTAKKGSNRTKAIIVVTADKGLAGAYNHNVLKLTEKMLECEENTKLYVVGEVGRQYFAGKNVHMDGQFKYTAQNPTLHRARVIGEKLVSEFRDGEVDEAYIVFTSMKNSMTSEANSIRLLPLSAELNDEEKAEFDKLAKEEIKFDPSPDDVLNNIIPNMVVGDIYSALVESYCSEQNDRMMAMDAANKTAEAMLHELSIEFNRVRQAMITQEITEVIAGAKAQKKKKARKEAQKA